MLFHARLFYDCTRCRLLGRSPVIGRRSPLFAALGLALSLPGTAFADCSSTTPDTGESVTCTPAAPNPSTQGVVAQPGSSGVGVDIASGTLLDVATGPGVHLRSDSRVDNAGTITLLAGNSWDALFADGNGNTLLNRGSLTTAGATADGIQVNGSNNTLTNAAGATIATSGSNANGLLSAGGTGNTLVNAGSITTTGAGSAGIRAQGGSGFTLLNTGSLRVEGSGSVGVLSDSGGVLSNEGSIFSVSGIGVSFTGSADTTLINRGSIRGATQAVASGAGNDRLDMQGGQLTGTVSQGAGNDSLVVSAGTMGAVDQGDGMDSARILGGTVNGTIQQGAGIDDFFMSGGEIGALLQGDALDTFLMTGGRIVGAFDDGDYAVMTGGRIGRVNMKLDDNTFDMSGGTIDGNLVTGFGRDIIRLSDGYIGGNISVSGGNDAVTVAGGTVRGEIRLSFGDDLFAWNGGGVVYGAIDLGEGTDIATLSSLNQSHLGATPLVDGGAGIDALSFDNVTTDNIARFRNWESVVARDDTELTFDGDLVLGDAGTGTGTLELDASSTLFAGAGAQAAVTPFNAGQWVTFTNAGRIDLSNGTSGATDTFTIVGNYIGQNAALYLQTELGADDSASDRLVIAGGNASGTTGLGILNLGGSGGQTVLDGILVVESLQGATSTGNAFALMSPVAAGAFEYFLFKGGISDGTAENWYLRSTIVAPPPP
ncbi:hypothetical protein ACYX7E_11120, partial [Luteimonas sp. RIT-PG2_3]